MIAIDFDSIIYALQPFGGASVYWKQIVGRMSQDPGFSVAERFTPRWKRGVPAYSNADVFHSSHFRVCAGRGVKTVSTVHDLTYELGFAGGGWKAKINVAERRVSYFTADALICISEKTKKDLLEVYPALAGRCPIHVIHHGFTPPAEDSAIRDGGEKVRKPYALHVGGRKGYKNFETALEGFHASGLWKDGMRLLCTGSAFDGDETERIRRLGLSEAVVAVGKVDERVLDALYADAHCLLYVSRHEGFGLPLLEAMSRQCPVIAAETSCLPEIAGDAAIFVPPLDAGAVAKALNALSDSSLKDKLVMRGLERIKDFSWEKSSRLHKKVYEETVSVTNL